MKSDFEDNRAFFKAAPIGEGRGFRAIMFCPNKEHFKE